MRPVDGLARDIISGPIDADKLDYLVRDSVSCGVSYGLGIDRFRFLRALTTDAKAVAGASRLALAYRAKGAASVEALLLTRYQMYGSVYWHHTFRCIQAMFAHAAALAFKESSPGFVKVGKLGVKLSSLQSLLYFRALRGRDLIWCQEHLKALNLPKELFASAPKEVRSDTVLDFLWRCCDERGRSLIDRLARRSLFRRVFELRLGDLGERGDYSVLKAALDPTLRPDLATTLQTSLFDSIAKRMSEKENLDTATENEARSAYVALRGSGEILLVLDFPVRGIPEEKNTPIEVGDSERKYISGARKLPSGGGAQRHRTVFGTVRGLQIGIASVRVFVDKSLHELVIRYLDPADIQVCMEESLPSIRLHD